MTYKVIKRTIDVILSFIGIILLSPLFLMLIILLALSVEHQVFYRQERIGYNFKLFYILKFATMLKNSPNLGNKSVTLRNDPRITRIGKYLRITKINELPQIINVLLGDMALVGPRPLLKNSYKKYTPEIQNVIYLNRPGITGIGSIVFRDEEKLVSEIKSRGYNPLDYYKDHIYPYKGALELYYYNNVSLLLDVKILFLTFWNILFSNSELVFKLIPDLPIKPSILSIEGIELSYKNTSQNL